MRKSLRVGRVSIKPGSSITVDLDVPDLYTHTGITLPVHVIHGARPGPILFLSGAIHGDEINGVEIIHRILKHKRISQIKGTLLAIPVVNIYGFINKTRYLPDRRDLNRSFPSSNTKPGWSAAPLRFFGFGMGVINLALRRLSVTFWVG